MQPAVKHDSDKRVIRTKRAIKNALFEIMKTKDISSITISELTIAANVNRRTFYTHYKSITDILNEIETELIYSIKELVDKVDANDYKNSVYKLFLGFHKLISEDFDYYFRLIRLDMRGILLTRLKDALSLVEQNSEKLDICTSNSAVRSASAYISGGFLNAYIDWSMAENKQPIEEVAEQVSTISAAIIQQYAE